MDSYQPETIPRRIYTATLQKQKQPLSSISLPPYIMFPQFAAQNPFPLVVSLLYNFIVLCLDVI